MGRKWDQQKPTGEQAGAEAASQHATFPVSARFNDAPGAGSETWIRALAGEWSERWSRSHGSSAPSLSNRTLAG